MKVLVLFISFSLSLFLPEDLSVIREALKVVESNNRTEVIGDNGRAYGILQIHKGAIMDVNRHYGTHFTHEDAFDEVCSEEIFCLYISMGIRRYQTRYGRCPPEKRIVQMWNFGIYQTPWNNGYYKKYLKIKSKI